MAKVSKTCTSNQDYPLKVIFLNYLTWEDYIEYFKNQKSYHSCCDSYYYVVSQNSV